MQIEKQNMTRYQLLQERLSLQPTGWRRWGLTFLAIFNLVLIEPGKSFVRVIQSIGRGIRKAEDKDFVQIWDITSTCKFDKKTSNKT